MMFRLIIKFAIALVIAALIAAYFTNPTKETFQHNVEERLNSELKEQLGNPVLKDIAAESTSFISQLVQNFIDRKNYYICSVFELKLPTGTFYYLGAYNSFFPLQKEDPIEDITNY